MLQHPSDGPVLKTDCNSVVVIQPQSLGPSHLLLNKNVVERDGQSALSADYAPSAPWSWGLVRPQSGPGTPSRTPPWVAGTPPGVCEQQAQVCGQNSNPSSESQSLALG